MSVNLKFDTRIIQHTNIGHYAVYIFSNILEDDYLKKILNRTLELTEKDSMNHQTNVKANMTEFTKLVDDPAYDIFKKTIFSFLKTCICLRTVGNVPNYYFHEFWAMKHEKGQRTIAHDHLGSDWAGVFYIDSDDNAAQIVFPDMEYSDIIRSNSLYLFPGMMPHYTTAYQSEKPRITLAFNLIDQTWPMKSCA